MQSTTTTRREARGSVFRSISSMIGETPLYELQRFHCGARAYIKLEQLNPGGSIKDRTALGMIRRAESEGLLYPGIRLVESSSGNTAIGLAMLASERGYRVTAICDRHLPEGKRARLFAYGADIVFLPHTPPGMDTVQLRIALAEYIAEHLPGSISLGQFSNPANPQIHYDTTGPEIWDALDGRVDAVVAAVGTCGTITGVGRYMKEQNAGVLIVGVEPEGSIIFGGVEKPFFVQGGGLNFIPTILDRSVVDRGFKVSDADAIAAAHELGASDGVMVGGTAGLVLQGLRRIGAELGPESTIVGILPDGGERYLDTVYDRRWLAEHAFGPRGDGSRTEDGALSAEMARIGCSVNVVPDGPGAELGALCRRIGAAPPRFAREVQP